jgi:hypothetical protein
MTKLYKYEDGDTVEITGDELKDILAIRKEYAAKKEAEAQAELDKATAKAELLDRLGITAEEAHLLLS